MGLFDISQNITHTQLNKILTMIPGDVSFVGVPSGGVWFKEMVKQDITSTTGEQYVSTEVLSYTKFEKAYKELHDVWITFINGFDKYQVNLQDEDNTVASQIGSIFKEMATGCECEIDVFPRFLAFNECSYNILRNAYNGYVVRHQFGQRGYEHDPDKIGYLYMRFTFSDHTLYWFFPLAML